MQLATMIDVADRLRLDLSGLEADGFPVSVVCTPLPNSVQERLPCCWIRMLGGTRGSVVIDEATLTLHAYAATWPQACDVASLLHARCMQLPYDPDAQTDWKAVNTIGLPYEDPDPDHPSIPRYSFSIGVTVKAVVTDPS